MNWPFRTSKQVDELKAQVAGLQDVVSAYNRNMFMGLGSGGLKNATSGLGGLNDKGEGFFYVPTLALNKSEFEILYAESWACRNFVDIPVDDMLVRWREFDDIDSDESAVIQKAERALGVRKRLAKAMKAGRLTGTGLLVMLTKEAPLNMPLNVDRVKPGDLVNLLVFDRFDCSTPAMDNNLLSPTYGKPLIYRINLRNGAQLEVHASRVLRFDAIEPMSDYRWTAPYEEYWGVSELPSLMSAITHEDAMARAVLHLVQESSIPVFGVQDFAESLSGSAEADMSLEQRATQVSQLKSLFNTVFKDANDTFERVEVNFANIPDLMDRYARRLAAAAKIPLTRFWGTSPVGLNATGDGDMRNYAIQVMAMQEALLREPLDRLDEVLMRHAGIKELPAYHFLPLTDMSEKDQTEIAEKKINMAVAAVGGGIMDEGEARTICSGDPIIGDLDENWIAPEPEEDLPLFGQVPGTKPLEGEPVA